jgi:hypothetical protein
VGSADVAAWTRAAPGGCGRVGPADVDALVRRMWTHLDKSRLDATLWLDPRLFSAKWVSPAGWSTHEWPRRVPQSRFRGPAFDHKLDFSRHLSEPIAVRGQLGRRSKGCSRRWERRTRAARIVIDDTSGTILDVLLAGPTGLRLTRADRPIATRPLARPCSQNNKPSISAEPTARNESDPVGFIPAGGCVGTIQGWPRCHRAASRTRPAPNQRFVVPGTPGAFRDSPGC